MKNESLKMIVTLLVICVLIAGGMSVVNGITAPIIAQNDVEKLNSSLALVLDADTFTETDAEENVQVYLAKKGGEQVGVCVVCTETGYGGDVKVLVGVKADSTVTGVQILSHSETAGLGANAEKESFRTQYIGKTSGVSVVKNSPKDNEIQAISGATITSNAVTRAVNRAIEIAAQY